MLPSGKGTISVSSDESASEIAHRLAEDAKDRETARDEGRLDKLQARRHFEVDYWAVRLVLLGAILLAAWILQTKGGNETAVRFAWGLMGSVIGAVIGMLKNSTSQRG